MGLIKLPGFLCVLSLLLMLWLLSCIPSTRGGEDARCSGLGTRRGIPSDSFGGDTFSAVDLLPMKEEEEEVTAEEDRGSRGAMR